MLFSYINNNTPHRLAGEHPIPGSCHENIQVDDDLGFGEIPVPHISVVYKHPTKKKHTTIWL
jgi:hypothetical protein